MKEVIKEIIRLHPDNTEASDREFTATLRIVVADTPMRAFLKAIIGHLAIGRVSDAFKRGCTSFRLRKRKTIRLKRTPQNKKKKEEEGIDNFRQFGC